VDSNIGVHQSSALIALMTAFNARLGWWIKNPKSPSRWDASGPSAAFPLFWEILGRTDASREYVHLSDGGHFENLGVYELVRRRCRYIVCVDAGTDRGASDDNLANMIRLVRTDFGVRIDLETGPLRSLGPDRLSKWHCAVGRIHYEDLDQGERPGVFVLLRTTMTGDEPPDVQEYAAKNPDFPLQSTLDQFFDESQFESYRALGHHVASTTFGDPLAELQSQGAFWTEHEERDEFVGNNRRFFSAVQRRWSSTPTNLDSAFASASRGWAGLQRMLQSNPVLGKLSRDIYPELAPSAEIANVFEPDATLIASLEAGVKTPRAGRDEARSELHAVAQMLQVMEDAWVGLRLRGYRDLPMYRGWMSIFRRWAATDAVGRLWPTLRVEFSQGFVQFCENELKLRAHSDAIAVQGDEPFAIQSIKRLDGAFRREWPKEGLGPATLCTRVLSDRSRADKASLWLIVQSDSEPAGELDPESQYACGVAGLFNRDGGGFYLFVWIEPAYRAMGIGGICAKRILKAIEAYAAEVRLPQDVFACFPRGGSSSEDNMDFELWKNFFARYDFKAVEDTNGSQSQNGVVLFKKTYPVPIA
jgi:GNAT superfamily N-acetyltransferase